MAGGWESLGLLPELLETIEDEFHWTLPTAIQDEAIPLILGGNDVMASAETGSGKSAAFALPILQLCVETKELKSKSKEKTDDTKSSSSSSLPTHQCRMSMQDRDISIAFDPTTSHGLKIQSRDPNKWAGCRASIGISVSSSKPGKYTYECTVLDEGLVRVGYATADATLILGTDSDGYGYGGTGVKVHQNNYDPFPEDRLTFGMNDVIGCHIEILDISSSKNSNDKNPDLVIISFSKNGSYIGEAFRIKKKSLDSKDVLFPTVCLKNAECSFCFGGGQNEGGGGIDEFKHPVPPGYKPFGSLRLGDDGTAAVANPRDALSLGSMSSSAGGVGKQKGPMAIVIEPTRDLAEQTYQAFVDLSANLKEFPVRSALLVGGVNSKDTNKALEKDQVDVLVGTPPIVATYMKKGTIQPSRCRFFVLDEADELISTDSMKNIRTIYGRLLAANAERSRFERLQVCFFSATLHSKEVRELAETICFQPLWIDLRGKNASIFPETVHHCFIDIDPSSAFVDDDSSNFVTSDAVHRKGKLDAPIDLSALSKKEADSERIKQAKFRAVKEIIDKFSMDQVLIFCRTNLDCDLMEKFLQNVGGGKGMVDKYTCRVLAGMRTMEERQKSLQDFKDGEARVLICTDVAARGIDIRELPFVINMTLPDKTETYVHRSGRVGRADCMGLVTCLVSTVEERVWFCQKGTKPPCSNTNDYEKGGNCIWYTEPKYFKEVQSLLDRNKVESFHMTYPEMKLPEKIEKVLKGGGYGSVMMEDLGDGEIPPKLKKIQDQVKEVEITEAALQTEFWILRNKFRAQSVTQ